MQSLKCPEGGADLRAGPAVAVPSDECVWGPTVNRILPSDDRRQQPVTIVVKKTQIKFVLLTLKITNKKL